MIDGRAEPAQDRGAAPGIDGSAEDNFLKKLGGQVLRAGKCQQDSAGVQMF